MSRKYKFHDPQALYFVSFAVVYWIDVFIRNQYREVLLECWEHCQTKKALKIHAWCIMTSHVHMIISSNKGNLADIMREMKSFSSKILRATIEEHPQESRKEWMLWMMQRAGKRNGNNTNFQFWQQHNQPIELFNNEILDQKLNYLHNNPIVAGWVDCPEAYLCSSAKDYAGQKGILPIDLIT